VTKNNKPVLIDFERCKKTSNPKNVTQFLQYIAKNSDNLEEKGFIVDRNRLFLLGKEYKDDSSLRNFNKILQFISERRLSRIESFKKD
jgi:predicted Ser/Thr protein kinase